MNLNELTITEAKKKLADKEISAVDLVGACIASIDKHDADVHAFLEVFNDEAFAQARVIDKQRTAGEELGDLAGIPLALKDNILMRGKKATAGSQILEQHIA
ncbi:MAG: amidase family protein, partial [Patescibacteria group bacterium]